MNMSSFVVFAESLVPSVVVELNFTIELLTARSFSSDNKGYY